MASEKASEAEVGKKPLIPLKDIVTQKYVVCLKCGKRMPTLRSHIKKAHGLMLKEYFKRFSLDPEKFPLICIEYSSQRSQLAKNRGFRVKGAHHEAKA
jgi:predicted transcriptional regulator